MKTENEENVYAGSECLEVNSLMKKAGGDFRRSKRSRNGLEVITAEGKARRFSFIKSSQNGLKCLQFSLMKTAGGKARLF